LRVFLAARQATDVLRDLIHVDDATGCYNNRGLQRRGHELATEAARRKQSVACLVVRPTTDLSNDGQGVAPDLAHRLGESIRRTTRASDVIARVGPLDFVVLALAAGTDQVTPLRDRISRLASAIEERVGGTGWIVDLVSWPPPAIGGLGQSGQYFGRLTDGLSAGSDRSSST
jgi:GGDEF domain-containing protein